MSGARSLFVCAGGEIALPASGAALIAREDGGNLVVNPPRRVWERSVLSVEELTAWDYLVAATGEAMLRVLPQLEGGCINYWEAGNWALNDAAAPARQKKTAPEFRCVHAHLLGRSRFSANPDAAWGESPAFPRYAERGVWGRDKALLNAQECAAIVTEAERVLRTKFSFDDARISPWSPCATCAYPSARGVCAVHS